MDRFWGFILAGPRPLCYSPAASCYQFRPPADAMRLSYAPRLVPFGLCLLMAATSGSAETKKQKKWYDPFALSPARDVRVAGCEAWGKRGGDAATQMMCETLKTDTDIDVRLAAARVLGDLKDPKARPVLGLALDDPYPAMRYRAVESLKKISGKDFDDLTSWREYAQGGEPKEPSLTSRLRRLF